MCWIMVYHRAAPVTNTHAFTHYSLLGFTTHPNNIREERSLEAKGSAAWVLAVVLTCDHTMN